MAGLLVGVRHCWCVSSGGSRRSEHHRSVGNRPQLRFTVTPAGGVAPVPFFPETEGIETMRPVDCEHSVEVIDLMLQQFSPVALEVGFVRPAPQIVIADAN